MNTYLNTLFLMVTMLFNTFQPAIPAAEPSASIVDQEIQTLDGTGNNQSNPSWGSANQQLLRKAPAAYADGINSPAGTNRPSARTVSNVFSQSPEEGILNDRHFTSYTYAWGQFLDHDIDLTPGISKDQQKSSGVSAAFPIVVPAGDQWFDPTSTGTMVIPMTRSAFDTSTGTSSTNPRQQVNFITAFIDGSQVYGVDAERSAALREFSGGLMKTSAGNLLPFNTNGLANANDAHRVDDTALFVAGDVRANENPELISMHTLFVREHNRIAGEAAQRHPEWTDEQLFQFARRVVISELQKITYDEFLPSILGNQALPAYKGYQPNVNPGIANEFSTAAFRFGHSMLSVDIEFLDNDGNAVREPMELRDAFFNPTVLGETGVDPILKYLSIGNGQEIDPIVNDEVRNFLFGAPGQGGFDLASLNIQRGRDHGLADYNTTRKAYGLNPVSSFEEITSNKAVAASLASTYGSVNNIDLWIGGLAEDHLPGSSMGETFSAILVDQFTRLRDGDRFWYQTALSGQMLNNMEHLTLADVIRRNTNITKLQSSVFFYTEGQTIIEDAPATTDGNHNNQNGQNGQNGQQGRRNQQPPQQAINACINLAQNNPCSFIGKQQKILTGTCQVTQTTQLACAPNENRRP